MYQTFKQVIVVLWVSMHASVDGQNCPYKVKITGFVVECTCYGSSIDCESLGLTNMPVMSSVGGSYLALNLESNSITSIPAGSIPLNLTGIYLQSNPISSVADTAFDDSASTLTTLYFSSALFKRIPDAFGHLNELIILSMQDLNITDWNEDVMRKLGHTMVSLYLDNVGFNSWPSWLQSFSHLSELRISKGSISLIPDDALDNSANSLRVLTMNNNKLTQVPKAFSKLTALTQLYLQDNEIVEVAWLPPSSSLQVLSLNNNWISNATVFSNAIRQYATSLNELDIYSNRLTSVPNVTFLTLMTSLDFSDNRISDPYSGAVSSIVNYIDFTLNFLPAIPRFFNTLQSVDVLDLPSNSIKQIQASDFPTTATMIQLASNLITELTDTSFPINSIIRELNLNKNPIATISSGAFSNLGQLRELYLEGARLTRVPLALSSLSSLLKLDLSNNTNLVCTCMEKGIEQWVISKSNFNIYGRCGLLEITQFFTILSPSCP